MDSVSRIHDLTSFSVAQIHQMGRQDNYCRHCKSCKDLGPGESICMAKCWLDGLCCMWFWKWVDVFLEVKRSPDVMTSISTVIAWSVQVPLVWHLYRPLSSALISLHCTMVSVILSKGRVLFSLTHCTSQCLLSRAIQWSLSEVPAITSMVDNDVSTSSDSAWPLYNFTLRDGSRPVKQHSKH